MPKLNRLTNNLYSMAYISPYNNFTYTNEIKIKKFFLLIKKKIQLMDETMWNVVNIFITEVCTGTRGKYLNCAQSKYCAKRYIEKETSGWESVKRFVFVSKCGTMRAKPISLSELRKDVRHNIALNGQLLSNPSHLICENLKWIESGISSIVNGRKCVKKLGWRRLIGSA